MQCPSCNQRDVVSGKELCAICAFRTATGGRLVITQDKESINYEFRPTIEVKPGDDLGKIIKSAVADRLVIPPEGINETNSITDNNTLPTNSISGDNVGSNLVSEQDNTETTKDDNGVRESIVPVSKGKVNEVPNDGKKYCQSCLERYGNLVLATREWTSGYFICDDCLQPLLDNIAQVDRIDVPKELEIDVIDSPVLDSFYDLLNIPEQLRQQSGDKVIHERNELFNHHATAIVNMSNVQIAEMIETYRVMLYNIKFAIEPWTDYINKAKAIEREKLQLTGYAKSKDEKGKKVKPSGAKLNQDEKMAKALGISLEKYLEMQRLTKTTKFANLTGDKVCEKCKINPCICDKAA